MADRATHHRPTDRDRRCVRADDRNVDRRSALTPPSNAPPNCSVSTLPLTATSTMPGCSTAIWPTIPSEIPPSPLPRLLRSPRIVPDSRSRLRLSPVTSTPSNASATNRPTGNTPNDYAPPPNPAACPSPTDEKARTRWFGPSRATGHPSRIRNLLHTCTNGARTRHERRFRQASTW